MFKKLFTVFLITFTLVSPAYAGALKFDGVDDRIKWSTLQTALANTTNGAWSVAILFKREATLGTWDGMVYLLSGVGGTTTEAGFSLSGDAGSDADTFIVDVSPTSSKQLSFQLQDTTNAYIVVVTKASGSDAPRFHFKNGVAGSWNHNDGVNAIANNTTATALEVCAWQGSDVCDAWIGLIAWWNIELDDTTIESLDNNWRSSDWWNVSNSNITFFAEFNVAGASVTDLKSNASNISVTGTSLDSGETLNGWNFDGTGAGGGGTQPKRSMHQFRLRRN